MNIIKNKKYFLGFSGIIVVLSIVMMAIFGFKTGIDFEGGTLWQIKGDIAAPQLQSFFENNLNVKNITVYPEPSSQSFLVRSNDISEAKHQEYLTALKSNFKNIEELRFESVGPTIGKELKTNAYEAIALVLLGISIYVAYAFRKVSFPVKSWKYGVITLITLFHDVIIPAGMLAILGKKFGIEMDTNFIVALLVVMGFSVHDTIVVFDRIRENLTLSRGKIDFDEVVDKSINQTMARSINTSLTLVLVLVALFVFGPVSLKYFILTILVGTIFGTYSSIFIASPLLTIWNKFSRV
ncbi:MAG: protein translocase subunit SecF [Patescibacteria group bacterium]|nr:protein translocase subunit SecF [Patescibacteria group bacterium]